MEANETYKLLFETGEADKRWCIEENSDGELCLTTNAMTREVVRPYLYDSWSSEALEKMREEMVEQGVSEELAERFVRQATVWP